MLFQQVIVPLRNSRKIGERAFRLALDFLSCKQCLTSDSHIFEHHTLLPGVWQTFYLGISTTQCTLHCGPALVQRHLPYARKSEEVRTDDVSRIYIELKICAS